MQAPTDFALLERWKSQRDAHAFKALTQRYGGMVFSVCNRVLKNAADAEEIAQECFLKLAQHPEKPERSVGPWTLPLFSYGGSSVFTVVIAIALLMNVSMRRHAVGPSLDRLR